MFFFIQIANIFDAWSTLTLVRADPALELNPIVRDVMQFGPEVLYPWKIALCLAATAPLAYLAGKRRPAWYVLIAVFVVYAGLSCLHAYLLSITPP